LKPLNQEGHKFCQSCGTKLIPLLLHRFKIIQPLGRGGFGKTYLAEDTHKLKEKCVVKQLVYQAQGSHANKLVVDMFMREAEQLQQLGGNSQIPSLFAYFEEGGYLYLVQQYVAGQDLLQELEEQGCFSDGQILALLQDLLPVFAAIHERNVIHRDIKPENIMRQESDGRLILIDFGVSKQLSKSILSMAGTMVGSLGYAAPEQMESGIAHPNSDLYSLGASCFHLMTGINPWSLWRKQGYGWLGQWQVHIQQPIRPELARVLDKLLQLEAKDRYQSAGEVLADLDQAKTQASADDLRRYEEEFRIAVQSAYPLHGYMRDGLKQLQQSLGLTDAAVARIEQPILAQAGAERQAQIRQEAEALALREEQLRQQAEAQQQEQLRQEAEAHRQEPQKQLSTTRRGFLSFLGWASVGVVVVFAGFNRSEDTSTDSSSDPSSSPRIEDVPPLPTEPLSTTEIITVDAQGNIIDRRPLPQLQTFTEDLGNSVSLEMIAIPGGTFTMGSPANELERFKDESPQHSVTVPAFYLGKYPITQAQWQAIMGSNPSRFQGANRPVESISWNEAIEFCQKLSQATGRAYRLPSEAEWEYGCRAGTTTPFYFGETITTDLANYDGKYTYGSAPKGQYREQTTKVGSFPPNAFGLYDLHGNVWEWCQDTWHENYNGAPTNGSAWVSENDNDSRTLRGGSWNSRPRNCRSASRVRLSPGLRNFSFGFRVALSASRTS
jgi:formylglycine-generating enzyme required for sulfatase activity/tRNA A-37 threonylcarbamoyl transferase component Bud32